jgi:DNA-binding transcriptional ArsR family regulator
MVGDISDAITPGHPNDEIESDRLAELFGLLSDPARAAVLYALLEAGELSLEELTGWTGVSAPRLSEALRVLRVAQVVSSRKSDAAVTYDLRGDLVRRLLEVASSGPVGRRQWLKGMDTTRSA